MQVKLNFPVCLIALSIVTLVKAQGGYEENSYEHPPNKMKFNIGFNLPSMSISLPKLELPQISIKASVKNKKPFTLKLPVIKFNGYANTEEDNSYGGGHAGGGDSGYGGGSANHGPGAGAGYNGPSSYGAASAGPAAYASGSGASGYVSATPVESYSSPASGYGDRPSSPSYSTADVGNQYTPNEPAYASSGYSPATQSASSSLYSGKAQHSLTQGPQYSLNEEHPAQPAYQLQNAYQAPSNVYNSRPVVNSYSGNSPSAQGNGYYVASVSNHQQQQQHAPRGLPSYREEPKVSAPVSLYQSGGNVYQGSNPYVLSSEAVHQSHQPQANYNGGGNGYASSAHGSFNRRTNRPSNLQYQETFKSYETSATSLPEGRYVLAPIGDDYKWQPLLLKV